MVDNGHFIAAFGLLLSIIVTAAANVRRRASAARPDGGPLFVAFWTVQTLEIDA